MEKETFEVFRPYLKVEDDPAFWITAWNAIVLRIETQAKKTPRLLPVYLLFGCCSHWLRPHQTRLTTTGGFAWPSGYLGGQHSRTGLPEFDWHVQFRWNATAAMWEPVSRFEGKRRLVCRIAAPARTAIHQQAVVHVRWEPGTIDNPTEKMTRFYAFRRRRRWRCVVTGVLQTDERKRNAATKRGYR